MLLVGTTNHRKLEEISSLLRDVSGAAPLCVQGTEILPPGPLVPESGDSFRENAALKAQAFAARAARLPSAQRPRWVLADDSGLCVEALGGAPGVRSARYAGEERSSQANNAKLLAALRAVPQGKRDAEFVCVLACVHLAERPTEAKEHAATFYVEGRCRGEIALEPRGHGGFGYDPLFVVPSLRKTFAELTQEEKNSLSHRGEALRAFRKKLIEELRKEVGNGWREALSPNEYG